MAASNVPSATAAAQVEIEVVAWTLARMLVEIYRSTGSDNEQIITGAEGELAKILQIEIRRGLEEHSNSGVGE